MNKAFLRPRPTFGFALSTALVVIFGVLLAGFTMASLASFNYKLAKDAQLSAEAIESARSGLALAQGQFLLNEKWGTNPADTLPESGITGSSSTSTDPATYEVTFHDGVAGLPRSVNNLNGYNDVPGPPDPANHDAPRIVPARTALVFVRGRAGVGSQATSRVLQAVLELPPTTYAVAASNSVICGEYINAGTTWMWHDAPVLPDEYRFRVVVDGVTGRSPSASDVPGSVYAGAATGGWKNGGSPNYSVFLTPFSTVSGDVVTETTNVVATATPMQNPTPVASHVNALAEPAQHLPDINVSDFFDASAQVWSSVPGQPAIIDGSVYIKGSSDPARPLEIGSGPDDTHGKGTPIVPLQLSNGTLYVDGNVVFPGGIVGPPDTTQPSGYSPATGRVFVNGVATVCVRRRALEVTDGGGVAIFSQRDLNIYPVGWAFNGSNDKGLWSMGGADGAPGTELPNPPEFYGTLYTRGDMTISTGIHVYGAIVANREPGSTEGGDIMLPWCAHITYLSNYAQFGNMDKGAKADHMIILYCREASAH